MALLLRSSVAFNAPVKRVLSKPRGSWTRLASTASLDAVESFARRQTLRELLPVSELAVALKGIREDEKTWESVRPVYDRVLERAETQLRAEDRAISALIGPEATERILTTVEGLEGDDDATRAFLKTPAVEGVVGSILYEGACHLGARLGLRVARSCAPA